LGAAHRQISCSTDLESNGEATEQAELRGTDHKKNIVKGCFWFLKGRNLKRSAGLRGKKTGNRQPHCKKAENRIRAGDKVSRKTSKTVIWVQTLEEGDWQP